MKSFLLSVIYCHLTLFVFSQTSNRGGAAENTSAASGKTHVILIGVSEYAFLPEDQQLDFADDDAQLFHDYLKTWGNIEFKLFLNQEAKRNIVSTELVNTLRFEAQSGDKVIIFFAGHGDVDEYYGDGYLLLNQCEQSNNKPYYDGEALSLERISEIIDKADKNGVEVTLIADACRSGSVLSAEANKMMSGININTTTMISCQHNEYSEESIKYGNGHGVFTYYLIQGMMGLADSNKDLKISLLELQTYVQTKVVTEREGQQTPVFTGKLMKEIAPVNEKLLAEAEKQDNLSLAITALGKKKAVTAPFGEVSSRCQSLMQLLIEQTAANKFFNDELDLLDQQAFSVGLIQSKKIHSSAVKSVTSAKGGVYTASAGSEGVSIITRQDLKNPKWIKDQKNATRVDFSPSGNILAIGNAVGIVTLYDPSSVELITTLPKLDAEVSTLKFISEKTLVAGTLKGTIHVIDIESNTSKQIKAHKGRVTDLEFKNTTLYSVGDDGKVCTIDITTKKKVLGVAAHTGRATAIKLLPISNAILTSGDDGKLKKWQVETLKLETEIALGYADVTDLEVDPFEKFCFIGSKQKKVGIIDLGTRAVLKSKMANTSGIMSISYDPSTYTLAMAENDGSVTFQKVKVNPDMNAAVDIHRQLMECGDLSKYKYKIDGTLIIGLNNYISGVLNPLVNGDAQQPSLEEIRKAIRYAKKALELGKDYVLDEKKLEINLLMLEVYEILALGDKSKFPQAIEKMKRIEELDPKGAYGFNVTAQLYAQMNNLEKAIEAIKKAETFAPNWSETTVNAGKILLQRGDPKAAEVKFKESITESPDLVKGYANLGALYLSQGKYEDAKKQLEKAISIDSTNSNVNQNYIEAISKIQAKAAKTTPVNKTVSTKKLSDYGPIISNTVMYYGYQNKVKFTSEKYEKEFKIAVDFGTIAKVGTGYIFVPKVGEKIAKLKVMDATTNAIIGVIELPTKSMPQPQLYWGKAKVDEKVDLTARVFVFGYKNEADLDNFFYKVISYEVLFADGGGSSAYNEFNPSGDSEGVMSFSGNGPEIYQELVDEITQRRSRGVNGKVCVAATVESPQGVRYKTSACFWY